jgi:hypothetical protein
MLTIFVAGAPMRRLAVLAVLLFAMPAAAQIGAGALSDLQRAGLGPDAPKAKRAAAPEGFSIVELPAPEGSALPEAASPVQRSEAKTEPPAERPCQDVPLIVRIGGQTTQAFARMCQGADGAWSLSK